MRNWIVKIIVLVVAVAIAATAVILFRQGRNSAAEVAGHITVELSDLSGRTERHELSFSEGDTLEVLLKEHFEVKYEYGPYGAVLIGIGFIQTDFQTTYVSILVNGEYAMYGLSDLALVDGTVYSFVEARA